MTLADFPAKVLLRRLRQQYRLVFQYPRRSSPSAEPPGTAQLVGTRRSRVSRKLLIGRPNSTPFTTHRKLRPDVDRPAMHPDRPRGFGLGHPLALDQEQGAPPQRLLRRPAEAAKIPCFHGGNVTVRRPDVRSILGRSVTLRPEHILT